MGDNLARRVAAVPTDAEQAAKPTVGQLIEQMKPQIARVLPKHMEPDRMARIALTLIRQNPALARCTPESFLGALLTASQLGLEPGPLGEAYLVPFKRWDKENRREYHEVQFIPGYRGLVKLAWQSGQLRNIDAHVVHEGDDFDYEYGLAPFLRHKPTRGEAGQATEVYAVATMQNGGSAFVVMSIPQVEAIRKRSKAAESGPWVSDWEAMAKKTAIKQLIRFLPLSVEMQRVNQAAAMDESVRATPAAITAPIEEADPSWIDADQDENEDTPEVPDATA